MFYAFFIGIEENNFLFSIYFSTDFKKTSGINTSTNCIEKFELISTLKEVDSIYLFFSSLALIFMAKPRLPLTIKSLNEFVFIIWQQHSFNINFSRY